MADPPDHGLDEGSRSGTWRRFGFTVAAVALLAIAVLAIHPLREAAGYAIRGDTTGLREQLDSLGAWSVALLGGLLFVHTFVWYPAEIVDAAAGFVFGFWVALPLVMIGWVLQALIAYSIGRNAARPLLAGLIGERRFARVELMIASGGPILLLAARLVPIVPFSLFSYVAGATRVPVPRFAWTTAVGYIPITAIFIYLGSKLEALSPTDPTIWGVAIAMIALLLLSNRLRPKLDPEEPDPEPEPAEPQESQGAA